MLRCTRLHVEISYKLLNERRQTADIETFLNWKSNVNKQEDAYAYFAEREKKAASRYIRDIPAIFTAVGSTNGIIDYAFLLRGEYFSVQRWFYGGF
jgi:hypothetical protein